LGGDSYRRTLVKVTFTADLPGATSDGVLTYDYLHACVALLSSIVTNVGLLIKGGGGLDKKVTAIGNGFVLVIRCVESLSF
jgi:hypothetical protein